MYTTLNKTNQKINTLRLFFFVALALSAVIPHLALAAGGVPDLVQGNVGIPGVDKDTPITKTLALTVGTLGFIFVLTVLFFGFADTISTFFRQLNDARKDGDWPTIIKFVAIAFVVIAIIFVIMGMISKYVITPLNAL